MTLSFPYSNRVLWTRPRPELGASPGNSANPKSTAESRAQMERPMSLSFPRFGHLPVGQALGLRRAPRPASRQVCKI
jgi:hypothetical protein